MTLKHNWTTKEILALSFLKGLNSIEKIQLVENTDSLQNITLTNLTKILQFKLSQNSLFDKNNKILLEKAEEQLDQCNQNNVKIVTIIDNNYPILLKEISSPPLLLYVKGNLQASNSVSIAIVGTRKCTNYGKMAVDKFASEFARNNLIVTSGLANGIDTLAHMTTIKNNGVTYAVLGSGIDKIGPSSYTLKNSRSIIESGGALISEYPCGEPARVAYFPQRNRIISGISKAVLVIESDKIGGSLITAKFAFEQSREVFAVPGNINSSRSRGTNGLIESNIATLASSPEKMLKALDLDFKSDENQSKIEFASKEEEVIYNIIDSEQVQIDEISQKSGIDMSNLLVILLNMEFSGKIKQLPGKYYIKA